MDGHVLVGADDSEDSLRAVREAARIARDQGVDLVVVHVLEVPSALLGMSGLGAAEIHETIRQVAAETRSRVEQALATSPAPWSWAERTGSAAGELLAEATDGHAGLVVVGSRGHGALGQLGSVAIKLVHHSPRSVLVVRGDLSAEGPPVR